jgi:large subunit ribosomal protein L23
MKPYNTIIRPIITEKSSNQQSLKRYTFAVKKRATKIDVKKAIKELYGVDVKEVRIIIAPSKTRMVKRGQLWIKRPLLKKAIVTLKGDKTIDPNKIKETKKQ